MSTRTYVCLFAGFVGVCIFLFVFFCFVFFFGGGEFCLVFCLFDWSGLVCFFILFFLPCFRRCILTTSGVYLHRGRHFIVMLTFNHSVLLASELIAQKKKCANRLWKHDLWKTTQTVVKTMGRLYRYLVPRFSTFPFNTPAYFDISVYTRLYKIARKNMGQCSLCS